MRIEDLIGWIYSTIIIIGVGLAGLAFIQIDTERTERIQACKDIGMEFHEAMDTKFCVDTFGKAHYAKFKCDDSLWNTKCTAQLISIGDVRIK